MSSTTPILPKDDTERRKRAFALWENRVETLKESVNGKKPEATMTYDKVRAVMSIYEHRLRPFVEYTGYSELNHVTGMLVEMATWGPERLEKMFRWLGFIQGVLWCEGMYTIDQMKEHNRPDQEIG